MNKISKKDESKDFKISNKLFEKLLKVCLIIGILVISGFILYFILTPEPGFVTFGILNENQEAGNYPKEAAVNETITFFLTVKNGLDREFIFRFHILKGNNETSLSSNGSNGTLYQTIGNFSLNPKESQIYGEYNISFSDVGEDQILIAELWQIKNEIEEYFNIIYWRLNITS
ncbi:MAG: DUF1616 domain-containing protein [Promethearchaeota archaeon]|nr:MAG: DUF1616 domain-containing protein [Candidatus Lokiarchaeota archaeon]